MGLPASVRRSCVDLVADGFSWSVSGIPSSMLIVLHRHLGAEIGDEVEVARADERVEALGAELAQLAARARSSSSA